MKKRVKKWECPGFGGMGTMVTNHTAEWTDGMKVTRLTIARGQVEMCIEWKGKHNILRLGRRVRKWDHDPHPTRQGR